MRGTASGQGPIGGLLTIASIALAVLVGLFVLLAGLASYKTAKVERRWAESLGTRDEILRRHPPEEANAAALELERLTARLGIDTATRSYTDRARPAPEASRRFKDLAGDMAGYRKDQLERPRRGPDPPPERVAAFLEAHADDLEAIRRHLIGAGVPRWEMHLERVAEAPIPNLLGHLEVQRVLVSDALAAVAEGERGRALDDLEASWTLMHSLVDSPILVTQLIVVADARLLAGALRQIEDAPPRWRDRLATHDFRGALTEALEYEGWYWTQLEDDAEATGLSGVAGGLLRGVAAPYVRYCLADVSDEFHRRLVNLERVRALCDYDLEARMADLRLTVPRWNAIGGLVVPKLTGFLDRLARLEFDRELTLRLLDLEQARRDRRGAWPPALPGGEVSIACPRDRWEYEVSAAGEMTLAFSRDISWEGVRGPRLSTRFSVGP